MGHTQAAGMAAAVDDGMIDLRTALSYHLTTNHYPPVPSSMIPVCIEAIEAYRDLRFEDAIDLPRGVTYRDQSYAPAWAIVEAHHLEAFIDTEDES